jgi:hypothetical protein
MKRLKKEELEVIMVPECKLKSGKVEKTLSSLLKTLA